MILLAILIGALAGLHTSTWGMYKDAPHEGFTWPKYFRSTLVGAVLGGVTQAIVHWDLCVPANRFVFWGLVYCLERAATEFWKYFIREEDQGKYFIPMQFGVMGVPMKDAPKRIAIGVLVGLGCVGVFLAIRALEDRFGGSWPRLVVVLTVGSFFGWISAFGGAWKDAPIEGFETFKFFRSPAVAASWARVVSQFTTSWPVIAIAAEGFTVASIETYKTFLFPHKPRGKFAGKPILHPEHLERRSRFVPVYATIWALVIVHLAWALTG
jgi:tetrahydromethanopterin S-methyltransferase subunit D